MENKRIPFDWEKYQSGEYTLICRNGEKPEQLTHNPNARTNSELVFWVNGEAHALSIKGFGVGYDDDKHDLFLIPKPKKFQVWVNLYSNGAAQSFISKEAADELNRFHIVNGVFRVECRLIEWEG